MLRIENHCCDCATPSYPCMGDSCPNRNVKVYYCDKCDPKCDYPLEEVYEVDGDDLCEECLKNMFKKRTGGLNHERNFDTLEEADEP